MICHRNLVSISRDIAPISRIVVIDAGIPSRCLLFELLTRVTRGENGTFDIASQREKIMHELGARDEGRVICRDIARAMSHSRTKVSCPLEVITHNVIAHPCDLPIEIINIRKQ